MPPKFDPSAYGRPSITKSSKPKSEVKVDTTTTDGKQVIVTARKVPREDATVGTVATQKPSQLTGSSLPRTNSIPQEVSGLRDSLRHSTTPEQSITHGASCPQDPPARPLLSVINDQVLYLNLPASFSGNTHVLSCQSGTDSKDLVQLIREDTTDSQNIQPSSINKPPSILSTKCVQGSDLQPRHRHVAPPAAEMFTAKLNPIGDRNDRLKQLQDVSLRQITRKTAARKGKDVGNSVSIRDLDLARAPVNVDDPKTSFRRWAPDSPLYDGGFHTDIPFSTIQKEAVSAAQDSVANLSHVSTAGTTQPTVTLPQRSRWAMKDEMKADKAEAGSNDWGSAIPSDATKASNISDASFGKLLKGQGQVGQEEFLIDWEGKMIPPPEDWAERPRYNNNNQDFKSRFRQYVRESEGRFGNGVAVTSVPVEALKAGDNHPDGISMRHRTETINKKNAARYGYTDDPQDAVKYAQAIDDADYEAKCELDPTDEGNASFDRQETTEILVSNWNKHLANARGESIAVGAPHLNTAQQQEEDSKDVKANPVRDESSMEEDDEYGVALVKPKLNIYLRPATKADLTELTRIYNHYVISGSQPAELMQVDESAMQSRMDFCNDGKLPFIVAAKKSQKGAKPIAITDSTEYSRRRGLPINHRQPLTLTRTEILAGFCCVNDFTQPDFVEHISADVEVYVDVEYQRMGVGKCLMDKILEICDRSHRLTMDVPFHCDQEVRHKYGPGGVRDLHKLSIALRKWSTPKAAVLSLDAPRKSRKPAFAKTHEDDYNRWLRKWLESLGFEVEGYLKRMGAKHGRYVDVVYLNRETCWQPREGNVPDPAPEFLNAGIADNEDDE